MRYRFLLIPPFRLPPKTKWGYQTLHLEGDKAKEERLMNADMVLPYLEDVEWDLHPGELATYGDWPVETREEFTFAANARLPNIREACESGKYNGIVLLGGGEPGFLEAGKSAEILSCLYGKCPFSNVLSHNARKQIFRRRYLGCS